MGDVYDFNEFKLRKRIKAIHTPPDLKAAIETILADMIHNDQGQIDLNYDAFTDDNDED